jgi:2'-5' RNA ligase
LDKLDSIIQTVTKVCQNHGNFELTIDQPKIFPVTDDQSRPARILNVSFQHNKTLQELYDKIEDALWQTGLAHKETRRFTPHLTVARIKQSTPIAEFKEFLTWPIDGTLPIDYIELQESILEKTGPTYFVLSTFNL